jgi:hypothetical protein
MKKAVITKKHKSIDRTSIIKCQVYQYCSDKPPASKFGGFRGQTQEFERLTEQYWAVHRPTFKA